MLIEPVVRERRGGDRHARVLLPGRVCGTARDALCMVHNISQGGLMARFAEPQRIGEALCIEMRGIDPVHGTVRWAHGVKAGIEFDRPIDLERLFRPGEDRRPRPRPLRFAVEAEATFDIGEGAFALPLVDVSTGGVKARAAGTLRRGDAGIFALPELGWSMRASVCWTRDERTGLRFVRAMPLAILGALLEE